LISFPATGSRDIFTEPTALRERKKRRRTLFPEE
jgi:hypothetical protein